MRHGDLDAIASAEKALTDTLEKFATTETFLRNTWRHGHTTDFGVMFLPIESLYAEVLRHHGVFESFNANTESR